MSTTKKEDEKEEWEGGAHWEIEWSGVHYERTDTGREKEKNVC